MHFLFFFVFLLLFPRVQKCDRERLTELLGVGNETLREFEEKKDGKGLHKIFDKTVKVLLQLVEDSYSRFQGYVCYIRPNCELKTWEQIISKRKRKVLHAKKVVI